MSNLAEISAAISHVEKAATALTAALHTLSTSTAGLFVTLSNRQAILDDTLEEMKDEGGDIAGKQEEATQLVEQARLLTAQIFVKYANALADLCNRTEDDFLRLVVGQGGLPAIISLIPRFIEARLLWPKSLNSPQIHQRLSLQSADAQLEKQFRS